MSKSVIFIIATILFFSCHKKIEQNKLKSKETTSEAIKFIVDTVLNDSTFVKELELAPLLSDRIKDSVFYRSLPYFNFLSKNDIDYIVWQQKQLKKLPISNFTSAYNKYIKDKFVPNGRNMYFELGPPLFSLSSDFFMIHCVIVGQEKNEPIWDAVIVMCQKKNGYWHVMQEFASPLKYDVDFYRKTDRFPYLPGFP